MPKRYCQGRILQAKVPEVRGGYKERPVIIVTPTDEITDGDSFQVVACTTQGESYPSEYNVSIPAGKCRGISSDSDAVCDWMPDVKEKDVVGVLGILPPKYLNQIISKLRKLSEAQSKPPPTAPP